jgi:hypothetical protein
MGVGIASVSGCFGGNESESQENEGPQSDIGTEVPLKTPSGSPPDFQIQSIDAPGFAEVNRPYEFDMTVTNNGGQAGVYRAPVTVQEDGSGYGQRGTAVIFLEPGEAKTATVSIPPFTSITSNAQIRVQGPSYSWGVEVQGAQLPLGEEFTLDNVVHSITSVEEQRSFSAGDCTVTAGDDETLLVATLRRESATDGQTLPPGKARYKFYYGNKDGQRLPTARCTSLDNSTFEVGEPPREQKLTFKIPDPDATAEDLYIRIDERATDSYAYWSAGFADDETDTTTVEGDGS